jgi:hypothetical protein
MFDRGEMSQKNFDTYFWLGLPKDLHTIFEPKLQAQILDYDASQPYELEKIETVAENYFKHNKFTEMIFNPLHYHIDEESHSESDDDSDDSDSDSEYERRRKRRHRKKKKTRTKYSRAKPMKEPEEKPTHQYQGSEQEISGMIKQLNKMSINDPAYANMRSLHFPPFSGRTPGGLRRTRPIQNANFLALEWLELSGDFPVTFRCMLVGLVSPTDFLAGLSVGLSPNQQSNSTRNDRTAAESPTEVRRTPTDTKQTAFLTSIINKK